MRSTMPPSSDDRCGTLLDGKWRLERRLGAGGMGEVYEAVHVRNAKRVAVKLLRAEVADADTVRRFLREGYLANVVDDPGVVSAFDDGTASDGSPYIVMELLEGESLEDRAERHGGRLPWREALSLLSPALRSLGRAHAVGVVHRDLKPSNLFLTREGRVKVLDFGLAGLRTSPELRLTAPDAPVMGTLGFMPPEQVRGEWDRVDARSDLWAMGATLFTLLTGRCVHENGPEAQFLKRAMMDRAPSVASLAPELPAEVVALVDRALAFEPEARFASAEAMHAALAGAYHGLTGLAVEDEATHQDEATHEHASRPARLDHAGPTSTARGRTEPMHQTGSASAATAIASPTAAGASSVSSARDHDAPMVSSHASPSHPRDWRWPVLLLGLTGAAVVAAWWWGARSAPTTWTPSAPLASGLVEPSSREASATPMAVSSSEPLPAASEPPAVRPAPAPGTASARPGGTPLQGNVKLVPTASARPTASVAPKPASSASPAVPIDLGQHQ
jgi:serine/threonine-protein kinase